MANGRYIHKKCPYCGEEYKMFVWNTIDGEKDIAKKKKLIDNNFYVRKCKKCNQKFEVIYPLTYIDESKKCGVLFILDELEELEATSELHQNDCWNLRIVNDQQEMVEKVRIFDMGYDDKIIELIKLDTIKLLRKKGIKSKLNEALAWVTDDCDVEIHMFFEGMDPENPIVILIPKNSYEEFANKLKKYTPKGNPKNYKIDMDWAIEFVSEKL